GELPTCFPDSVRRSRVVSAAPRRGGAAPRAAARATAERDAEDDEDLDRGRVLGEPEERDDVEVRVVVEAHLHARAEQEFLLGVVARALDGRALVLRLDAEREALVDDAAREGRRRAHLLRLLVLDLALVEEVHAPVPAGRAAEVVGEE